MNLSIAFQPDILGVMKQFDGFHEQLDARIANATEKSAGVIGTAGVANMNWQNPTGALEGSIQVVMQDAYDALIGSDLPYANRREFGFSGMTDSLGRFYPNDPGAFFMTNAIEDASVQQQIAAIYTEELLGAWGDFTGGMGGSPAAIVTAGG